MYDIKVYSKKEYYKKDRFDANIEFKSASEIGEGFLGTVRIVDSEGDVHLLNMDEISSIVLSDVVESEEK